MKKNVVSQLAGQLQVLSSTFRKNQRDYLQRNLWLLVTCYSF
jgi:hypothetical protein